MIERFERMPDALRANARWQLITERDVPALLVHPDWNFAHKAPVVIWMHGRTAKKELDPGRYLRWMRAGIGTCAVDLPGHGQRFDPAVQEPGRTLELVVQMHDEIDLITEALGAFGVFDMHRLAIGGMSAGGMAALARLCTDHPFICVAVEATSGSWVHQQHRAMFRGRGFDEINRLNPINRLDGWREIPLMALHAKHDEWVAVQGQRAFINALRSRYRDADLIEYIEYGRTGAPYEHAGFGKMAAEAKNAQRDFLARWLLNTSPGTDGDS